MTHRTTPRADERVLSLAGIPQHVTGLGEVVGNPVHATGVGLLLMGSQIEHPRRPSLPTGRAGSMFKKLKTWFRGEF